MFRVNVMFAHHYALGCNRRARRVMILGAYCEVYRLTRGSSLGLVCTLRNTLVYDRYATRYLDRCADRVYVSF